MSQFLEQLSSATAFAWDALSLTRIEIDQDMPIGSTGFGWGPVVGQSFTVQTRGRLCSISILFGSVTASGSVVLRIVRTEPDGSPPTHWDTQTLTKVVKTFSEDSRFPLWVQFNFPSISVRPGDQYVWILEKQSGASSLRGSHWSHEDRPEIYLGGELWMLTNSKDGNQRWEQYRDGGAHLAFQTYVRVSGFRRNAPRIRLTRIGPSRPSEHSAPIPSTATPFDNSYTLWMPFSFAPGFQIQDLEVAFPVRIRGHAGALERHGSSYVLWLAGFSTEEDARMFIDCIGAALLWSAVRWGRGVRFDLGTTRVAYADDPGEAAKNFEANFGIKSDRPIDGVFDGTKPAIYPSRKHLRKFWGGTMTMFLSTHPKSFIEAVKEGVDFARPEAIIADEKLKLAVDIYCLSHFEASVNARFLTLTTALEVLAPELNRPDAALEMIDKWRAEARKLAETTPDDSLSRSLTALNGGLERLRTESIAHGLQTLVTKLLEQAGNPDAFSRGREVVRLYRKRSKLTHRGTASLAREYSRLDAIVRATLEAAMRNRAA